MEEVTAGVYLVSISQSRYSAVYDGGHAKTVFLHAAISAAAHQTCEMLMNVNFRICRDERSELCSALGHRLSAFLFLNFYRDFQVKIRRRPASRGSKFSRSLTSLSPCDLVVRPFRRMSDVITHRQLARSPAKY